MPRKTGAYIDKTGRVLTKEELDQLFNPFYGIKFIYRYGFIFLD